MAKQKSKEKGWCPFVQGACKEKCVFYRKGFRFFEARPGHSKPEPMPFEECAINIFADSAEQMVSRQVGVQKALESARNEVNNLRGFFQAAFAATKERRELETIVGSGVQLQHISELEKELAEEKAKNKEEVIEVDIKEGE